MISSKCTLEAHISFGSDNLFASLVAFAGLEYGGQIIFAGDEAQLPPVGDNLSTAMRAAFFREQGLRVDSVDWQNAPGKAASTEPTSPQQSPPPLARKIPRSNNSSRASRPTENLNDQERFRRDLNLPPHPVQHTLQPLPRPSAQPQHTHLPLARRQTKHPPSQTLCTLRRSLPPQINRLLEHPETKPQKPPPETRPPPPQLRTRRRQIKQHKNPHPSKPPPPETVCPPSPN